MRIAVKSVVVFDVPDDGPSATLDLGLIRDRLYDAHQAFIGEPMQTVTGQHYVLRRIERLEVERAR